MTTGRASHTTTLLPNGKVLVAGGFGDSGTLASAELYDPATGTWTPTGSLTTARQWHAATLLPNGKVLVTGGSNNGVYLASAELYDPAIGAWTTTGSLGAASYSHTTTLLPNGKALLVGETDAELYDPATGTWTVTANPTTTRVSHTATLLTNGKVLITGGYANGSYLVSSELYDPATGTWTVTGDLTNARSDHTTTLLPNGKVIVAGGYNTTTLASAELYDPATGTWTATGNLTTARLDHAATLLPNGLLLITGGSASGSFVTSAELYDPTTGTWAVNGSLSNARSLHTMTLLPNGKALIVGGQGITGNLASAEFCDPAAGSWTATASVATARHDHTATLLANGAVLIAGGWGSSSDLSSAELYNPATQNWTTTGGMGGTRFKHTATLLSNGKVLVTGGEYNLGGGSTIPIGNAQLFNATTGTWSDTAGLITALSRHTATLLANGKVLVAGGWNPINPSHRDYAFEYAELYDPAIGTWTPTGSLTSERFYHTATLLKNGTVLVVGGRGASYEALASTEVYDPVSGQWTVTGSLSTARYHHTATLLPNGKVLAAGGNRSSSQALASAELYDPATGTWSVTGALATVHAFHTATLLPNGKVLVAGGGEEGNGSYTAIAELYDPTAGTWTQPSNLSTQRCNHTATLLPNGEVLVAGGYGYFYVPHSQGPPGMSLSSVEIYDTGLGFSAPSWQPQVATTTPFLPPGGCLLLTGTCFRGISGACGGNSQDSSTNYPLVQLRSLDNGQVAFLSPDPATGWSDSSFSSAPVNGFPCGPSLATVFTNGIPSVSSILVVGVNPPATLAYASNPATYVVNQSIANNTPTTSGGTATFYSITPSLPTGLSFNSSTGVISGVPAVIASATNYTVTASNLDGSTTATLNLAVISAPVVVTGTASGVTASSGTLNGTVNSGGLPTTVYFQYGKTTDYAGITGTMDGGSGTSVTSYSAAISGLTPGTTYHFQIVAFNSLGTTYGLDQTFISEPAPTVTTGTATAIVYNGGNLNGTVNPNGLPTTFYFRYGTTTSYGYTTGTQSAGSGLSPLPLSMAIGSLNSATVYHFQIVAFNSSGISYGLDQTFATANPPPTATTGAATGTVYNASTLTGTANPNSLATNVWFQYGTSTSYTYTTGTQSAGNGSIALPFNAPVSGLNASTVYHYRIVAANSSGTTNGLDQTFITANPPPTVTTGITTGTLCNGGTLIGTVNPNGLASTVWFLYGTGTSYTYTTGSQSAGSGSSAAPFSATISGLNAATIYHYQIVAANSSGTSYGLDQAFTTANPPPTVITGTATGIGYDSATLNGMINASGLSTTFYFRYGTSTGYGDATSTQDAGNGSSSAPFSLAISGLNPLTLYHFQIVATNSSGKSYGLDQTFTTANPPPAPPPPTGLTATAGNALVTLTWNASTGATGYNVKRSLTSGTNYTVIANNIPTTACTDIGVANGTTYYYVVSALNLGGESGDTSEVTVTPQASKAPTLSTSGSNVLVTIPDSVGRTYQLQRNDTLNPQDWINIGSAQAGKGKGKGLEFQDIGGATGITRRFYRVLIHQ